MIGRNGKQQGRGGGWRDVVNGVVVGAGLSLLVIGILLATAAGAMCAGVLGENECDGVVVAACGIGCFLGGVVASKRTGVGRLCMGAVVSVTVVALLVAVSALVYRETALKDGCASVIVACLLGGGMCGVPGKRKRPAARKKRSSAK